ncbi:PAS domain-containing protein [Ktedonobacter racemifer]|uniref:histidine kinase n=1 Tax=Ktedonobacter racemifer DSM 44963 TaxID=485913 RepID=D6TYQ0_KTERA|nr:PAS domain-containing protein [Ktedonobacter racemifer]EFH85125.1 multi-sensor signal transduction histidine kinase [Ktedonobacter racemifer DSM 44963]
MQQHQEGIGQEYHPNIISLMQTEQFDKKRKPRILLVDDDMAALQALSRTFMLRMSDVDVDTSSSALDALAQLQSREYDVVVSDIKMPMMDGIQLLSNIHKRMPDIPVLLITGHGEHELAMQALQEGAYDYTLKPIDRDFFVAGVRRALQTRQLFRLVQEKQQAIEEQKRTEQQLKESEENFRVLAEMVPQFVWVTRSDGRVDYCNQRRRDYIGLTLEQLQSDCCAYLQAVHPEDWESSRAHWQHALDTGDIYEHEQRMRQGTTGEYRWFLARALPVRDDTGQIIKWFGTDTDIEEQKRIEQQLKESRESLRVLAEAVPQLVWVARPDGQFEYTNQRWDDYTGLTHEPGQSDRWAHRQCIHPDDREGNRAHCQHALATGDMFEHEHRIRNGQTGEYRWFLTRALPVKDDTGQVLKWFGTCTDIEEQKRIEQQLKESEENWRVLAETLPHLVWAVRSDGRLEYANQHVSTYLGAFPDSFLGDEWRQFVHPDDYERVQAARRHVLETGEPYEGEYRLKERQTGRYRWFLARLMPVRDETGQIVKRFGTATDIEEQKQAEQQLKESEENWRVLAEMVPQLVWVRRPDGPHEYTNQRWCDYTGLTLEHMRSDQWAHLQFVHPDDQESNRVHWQHALDTGAMFEHEVRLRNAQTGKYRWFLARAMPVRDEAGQIIKWFGTDTDIEEQKRIEAALRQSQERVNALMNSSIIGITISEGEQIVDANDAFLHMTGYTREDLHEGRINWMHMTPPECLARTFEAHQELIAQQSTSPYEKEYVCQDGSRLPVLMGLVALPHQPHQTIGFVLDNSARKELEQRKDDFINMASHELRNPLAALKMQTQLVRKRLEKQSHHKAATALSKVEGPIKQLERLIAELLDVSRIQAGKLEYQQEPVDLDALLQEVTETLPQIYPSHRILVDGAVHTSLIGDRDRLGQVFANLLCNAIKYSPGAETVEMDLSASDDMVTIRVRDHGLGIPREQRDKIFERFYRVAGPRQKAIPGLGMGLYIVSEIVKHHGGSITVDSEVGKGSTFTVTLPTMREA